MAGRKWASGGLGDSGAGQWDGTGGSVASDTCKLNRIKKKHIWRSSLRVL
jgi:hypothetical protein